MPAISPAQLKIQSIELAELYVNTSLFVKGLYDLLERYADHSYRAGDVSVSRSLIPSLNVPSQILKQISLAIREAAGQDREAILALCEALWGEPNLESRLLASKILGQSSFLDESEILNKVQEWQPFFLDDELQRSILDASLSSLIGRNPNLVLGLADSWLESGDTRRKKTGILLLERLVADTGFENSPAIFKRVSPLFRQAPIDLHPALISLLNQMANRFSQETTYVLTESLTASDNPDTHLLIRQVLKFLPPDSRKKLRSLMQEVKRQPKL